jgi:hypothetical protein
VAKKKDRAFFICPRWSEVAQPGPVNEKTRAAIEAGRPVARSTLRRALLAARAGSAHVIETYIVDQRQA